MKFQAFDRVGIAKELVQVHNTHEPELKTEDKHHKPRHNEENYIEWA